MLTIQGKKYRITPRGKWIIGILSVFLMGTIYAISLSVFEVKPLNDASALQNSNTVNHTATSEAPQQKNVKKPIPKEFSIFFDPDGFALRDEYQEQLNAVVIYLKEHPEYQLHLAGNYNGYPDLKGKYFETLAIERAESVKSYLMFKGIEEKRITISNNGSSKPMNQNTTKIELAKNRRVDVTVIN